MILVPKQSKACGERLQGIKYDENIAHVTRLEAIRIIITFSSHMNMKLFQMDVKIKFLNGHLKEEVYVE